MHLVVRFLGYLEYLLINLGIIYIDRKLNIIVGKGIENICTKEYKYVYFIPKLF